MLAKKSAEVLIDGKVYTLSGYEDEDFLQRVASYINTKIEDINSVEEFRRYTKDMKAMMVAINIAYDYFKAKGSADKFSSDCDAKDEEIYKLKHEKITDNVKIESLEEELAELKDKNRELTAEKSKLAASLEDALLGSVGEADE